MVRDTQVVSLYNHKSLKGGRLNSEVKHAPLIGIELKSVFNNCTYL